MNFVHPSFLFAFFSLAIPILIHLFNFRKYKKIYFTNVRFLTEIQQETKRQSELKQYLLLVSRLLMIAAIVMAFAQPYLPSGLSEKKNTGSKSVSIYIDNSFSMEALSANGKLLDLAKLKALEILTTYQESDVFQLLTNDFEGKHQHFCTKEEFKKMVEEIQPSPVFRKLSDIMARQKEMFSSSLHKNHDAFILSDFQTRFANFHEIKTDSSVFWFLYPLSPQKRNNLYIDTLFFESPVHQPNQAVRLKAKIRNASDENLEKIPVKLKINGIQKALASFSAPPRSTTELIVPFTENSGGIQNGMLELMDYPVTFDDHFYFSYPILPLIHILAISGKNDNQYMNMVFGLDSSFFYVTTSDKKINYGSLPEFSLVVLNGLQELSSGLMQELERYLTEGGNLLILPPEQLISESYRIFLSSINMPYFLKQDTTRQLISEMALESDLFKDIFENNSSEKIKLQGNLDYPTVFNHYTLGNTQRSNQEVLIRLQYGHPFLTSGSVGKGNIYLFSSPFHEQWNNFPKHILFLPVLYKIALMCVSSPEIFYLIGEEPKIEIPIDTLDEKKLIRIKNSKSDFEMIPEIKYFGSNIFIFPHDQIKEAGWYSVLEGKEPITGLAFNYDRRESDLKCFTLEDIREEMKRFPSKSVYLLDEKKPSLSLQLKKINEGTPLWKYFIILSLLFIISEILIIRFIKP